MIIHVRFMHHAKQNEFTLQFTGKHGYSLTKWLLRAASITQYIAIVVYIVESKFSGMATQSMFRYVEHFTSARQKYEACLSVTMYWKLGQFDVGHLLNVHSF